MSADLLIFGKSTAHFIKQHSPKPNLPKGLLYSAIFISNNSNLALANILKRPKE